HTGIASDHIRRSQLPAEIQKALPEKYIGFQFGQDRLLGITQSDYGTQIRAINDLSVIKTVMPGLLGHVGKDMHWDWAGSVPGVLRGSFSTLHAADVDPYAHLGKGGYKFAQQFRTLGLNMTGQLHYAQAMNMLGGQTYRRGALM